jgi:hypothetical protein
MTSEPNAVGFELRLDLNPDAHHSDRPYRFDERRVERAHCAGSARPRPCPITKFQQAQRPKGFRAKAKS